MSVSRKLYPLLQCHVSEIRIKIVRHTPRLTRHLLFLFFFLFAVCLGTLLLKLGHFASGRDKMLYYINDPWSSKLAKSGLFLQDFEVIGLRLQFSF